MKRSTKTILSTLSFLFLVFGFPLMNINCSGSEEFIPEKMDSPLQQKIRSLEAENSNVTIQFTGKTSGEITPEMKNELESTGATIESTIHNIFTAKGTTSAIKKISLNEYVVYLELARTLDIK
jgi:hypothetical protein